MKISASEIRRSFLSYFEQRQHRIVPSSPLVPHDDPTLLFTNAGMNQFKDVFLGREKRSYTRAASSQKCARAGGKHNDLENVGRTARHLTFFEMLGNFSFGDYFKSDAIRFAWDLLVDVWGLDTNRLWFTVFEGDASIPADEEAAGLWIKVGASPDRVLRFGKKDNFWSMGETGPCGPCSEIHYFRGADISKNVPSLVNGPGDDTMEIWNLVFMQYDRDASTQLTPLPAPSIDTGAGLERLATVLQNVPTVYDIDSFRAILDAIADISGHRYGGDMKDDRDTAARVICDHSRSTTFLIGDGVIPSNEGRGYVLRKIMRRAMLHGHHLGLNEPFLYKLVAVLAREMGDAYPELRANRERIEKEVFTEEKRFDAVLTEGLPRLEAEIAKAIKSSGRVMSGEAAFRLHDTFGVPYDFIEDTAATQDVRVDKAAFEAAMEEQRGKARAQSKFGAAASADVLAWRTRPDLEKTPDAFRGYEATSLDTRIVELLNAQRESVEQLKKDETGFVALAETPFYLQSGGQVSDVGRITSPGGTATVTDVVKGPADLPRFQAVTVTQGVLQRGDTVSAQVDASARDATRRNHTATHLLHAALRRVLGAHVKQAGSLVAPDRLRFDFAHFASLTHEQIAEIERIVNEQIVRNTPVETELKDTQEAIAAGAMALFGEKYGDRVRVVSVPDFSIELCGGTHVRATGDIGLFAIVSESGVAAGVRRVEAITGLDSVDAFQRQRDEIARVATALNARPGELSARAAALQEENRRLTRDLQQARMKAAMGGGGSAAADEAIDVAGVKLIAREVAGLDKDGLRSLVDQHRSRIKTGVVILASPSDGKVMIVVGVTPDLTKRIPAGQVVKRIAPLVGGGGGGRADFAEAGGKDPSKIQEMLAASRGIVEELLTEA
jgi:alanyl-tRNA synthetase